MLSALLQWVYMHPEVFWGVLARGVGLVHAVNMAGWFLNSAALVGPNGTCPLRHTFAQARAKLPLSARVQYFTSLFAVNQSLGFIQMVLLLGLAAAAAVVFGAAGLHSRLAFAWMFAVHHSLPHCTCPAACCGVCSRPAALMLV